MPTVAQAALTDSLMEALNHLKICLKVWAMTLWFGHDSCNVIGSIQIPTCRAPGLWTSVATPFFALPGQWDYHRSCYLYNIC